MRPHIICSALLLLAALACDRASSGDTVRVATPAGVIDSAIPIEEHLRRFRATVNAQPDTLRHASPSRDALIQRWLLAVQSQDTVALNGMLLDRAEFAWLFYPHHRLAKEPYEMPPGLLWEQLMANSNDGAGKVLKRFEGRRMSLRSARCPAPPDTAGPNLVYQGCLLRLRAGTDTLAEERYFGSILQRDGRYKFIGYANKL